jgi:hypothetical protein
MKKLVSISVIILGVLFGAQAQVGIGTNSPTATLDVNGTVRVTNLPITNTDKKSLTGHNATSGVLNRTKLGANLIIKDNSIEIAPVSGTIGSPNLGAHANTAGLILDLNLEISSGSSNSLATFIRLHSYTARTIAGITNGVPGRHVTLFWSETANISLSENNLSALPQDRILTAATSGIATSGMGFFHLVYDANGGADNLGRWVIIKFRP